MVREPCEYAIHGRINRVGPREYVVLVTITSTEPVGPGASFIEEGKARSREAAARCLWEMVREISARLRAQGNRVVNVETDV
jgi:hypothetical protein